MSAPNEEPAGGAFSLVVTVNAANPDGQPFVLELECAPDAPGPGDRWRVGGGPWCAKWATPEGRAVAMLEAAALVCLQSLAEAEAAAAITEAEAIISGG